METQSKFSYWDDVILSKSKEHLQMTMPKPKIKNSKKCVTEDPFQDAVLPVGVLPVNPLKEDVG